MAIRILMLALCALLFGCGTPSGPKFEPLTGFKALQPRDCPGTGAACPPIVLSVTPASCGTDPTVNPNDKNQCTWSFDDPIVVTGKHITITWTLPDGPNGFMFCTQDTAGAVMKDGAYFRPNKELEPLLPVTPVASGFGTCWRSFKTFNKKDAPGTYPYQLVFRREIDGAIVAIDPAMINRGS